MDLPVVWTLPSCRSVRSKTEVVSSFELIPEPIPGLKNSNPLTNRPDRAFAMFTDRSIHATRPPLADSQEFVAVDAATPSGLWRAPAPGPLRAREPCL